MNEKDIELPLFASQVASDNDLSLRCGTMLMLAGLMTIDGERRDKADPDSESDKPIFI